MAKINRYRLEYGYGSLEKEMKRTLEPANDSDYIKVSELRERLNQEIDKLKEQNVISYNDGYINGLRFVLAAIDTEGK